MSEPARAPGVALALGIALSLPVALRSVSIAPSGAATPPEPLAALLLMWAAASLLVVPIGLWIRGASLKDPASGDRAVLLAAALSSLPLALFGSVLKSATHHRPLGGATFAVVASILLAFCVGLALRVGRGGAGRDSRPVWLSRFFLVTCLASFAGALLLGVASVRALLDFVMLAGACAAAGLWKIPTKLAALPVPAVGVLWVVLLSGGLWLTWRPELMSEARARAPVSFAAFSWLGGGS